MNAPTGKRSSRFWSRNFSAIDCFFWMSRRAALSPQRELAFLVLLHDTLHKHKDAQFIISGHSPLLLGYPEAQILSFDGGKIHEIELRIYSLFRLLVAS
jgi:predicted ATPase